MVSGIKAVITSLVLVSFLGCGSDNSESFSPVDNNDSSDINSSVDLNDTSGGDNTVDTNDTTDNTIDYNGTKTLNFVDGITTQALTVNSQAVAIEVNVFDIDNVPSQSGMIKVAYPAKVTTGVDVGSFTAYSAQLQNGKAIFNYTGPKDLKDRIENNDTETVFGFYLEDDPTVAKNFTLTYNPPADQIILKTYNIGLTISEYSMALESYKQIAIYVEDEKGIKVSDDKVDAMTLTILNPALADLEDALGHKGDSLSFTTNVDAVNVHSNTISGIVPIEVNATFVDANGDTQTLSDIINITVLSGPPTAMSIHYKGSSYDAETARFIDTMIVSVTDKYFNPVNTQPAVSSYLIAGYTLEDNTDLTSKLYINTFNSKAGTMDPDTDSLTSTADFSNVDPANDILLTFGNNYTYDVSGKWDISAVNGNELLLGDNVDTNVSVSNIGFAIGNNFRQDTCRDGEEWVGTVRLNSDRFSTNGIVEAEIYYPSYLVGKDVTLGIDTVGYTAITDTTSKFGEAHKHTLRSTGFSPNGSCSIPGGAVGYPCTISILITDTNEWLRNAHFGANVKVSDGVTATEVDSSNYDINDCTASNGISYITFSVSNGKAETGSVSLEDILIGQEF